MKIDANLNLLYATCVMQICVTKYEKKYFIFISDNASATMDKYSKNTVFQIKKNNML